VSIHAAIEHRTTYHFDRLVGIGPHLVRLRPAPHCRTPILAYSLQVQPTGHFLNWQQDPFGNHLARLVFPEPARELSVTVGLLADMAAINPFDFFLDEDAQAWPLCYDPELARDLAPYLEIGAGGPRLEGWIAGVPRTATPTIDFLVALNERVRGDVTYELRMDPGVQAPEQTLTRASGSCRDSAWLLVEILRRLGIAARFASGYLVQLREDEHLGGDFTDLHAWAEAYVPGAGWVGLDPTSGLLAGEGHIPLACTALPASAAPISGTVDPCETTLEFSNTVQRILERPPAPDPYRAGQWERIDALGRAVDADLLADDVRLTMGGEPTFVAAGATEAPEWSTEAVGGAKLALARALALRLADALAPGALIHHGQGKWYPGEPLPRWQIGVHWRADATPLWHDRALLADPSAPGTATAQDAGALAGALARGLALAAEALVPAYEDPVAIHWAGVRQPAGEPAEAEDPRALAALEHDHGEPHGWAIPLQREFGDPHWSSAPWTLRRGRLFLIPGDSPLGLRLPLDALTWTPPEPEPERSRFAPVEATLPRAD
jgi:transglutaminase-like putative cysteine protease